MPIDDDEFESTIVTGRKWTPDGVSGADAFGHYLVVSRDDEPGVRVEIGAAPVTIGRDAKHTIVLVDSQISRAHARVTLVGHKVVVEDLGSTNGTFLDGHRLTAPTALNEGHALRLGHHLLTYERRSRRDVEREVELNRDLRKAGGYVRSLLPPPLTSGPVLAEWRFVPSAQLGGDAFGYDWLTPDSFAFYLFDVSGHGVGAAMHSVAVLNVLRQRALPHVDFGDPGAVLSSLNDRFQMDTHGDMFLTAWYGVYHVTERRLRFSSAGHHPVSLVRSDRTAAQPLGSPALMIGAIPGVTYQTQHITVPHGSTAYLFSDGAFEITTTEGTRWTLSDFEPVLLEAPLPGTAESERVYTTVRRTTGPKPLEDDFSLMVLTFP